MQSNCVQDNQLYAGARAPPRIRDLYSKIFENLQNIFSIGPS